MNLEALKERVKGLRSIVNSGLTGAKDGLKKLKESEDLQAQQHYEKNIPILEEGLSDLQQLNRDIDRCMGAPNQLGCDVEELCTRYRDICTRTKNASVTLASGQSCTC